MFARDLKTLRASFMAVEKNGSYEERVSHKDTQMRIDSKEKCICLLWERFRKPGEPNYRQTEMVYTKDETVGIFLEVVPGQGALSDKTSGLLKYTFL